MHQKGRLCANCGVTILWPSLLVNGIEYCCGGCALGGPCYCSYDEVSSHASAVEEAEITSSLHDGLPQHTEP